VPYYPVLLSWGHRLRSLLKMAYLVLTFTITDLHLLDAPCHTCCMAQCDVLLQPMSDTSAASLTATATAASTAVMTAVVTQTVATTAATVNRACCHLYVGRHHGCCLSSFSVSGSTLHDCTNSLRDASECIVQLNITLLDYIPYLKQYPHDPGNMPSSANKCILGKMYLRSNLSRTQRSA